MTHDLEIHPDGLMAVLTIRDTDGMGWSVGGQFSDEAVGVRGNRRPTSLVVTPGCKLSEIKVIERDMAPRPLEAPGMSALTDDEWAQINADRTKAEADTLPADDHHYNTACDDRPGCTIPQHHAMEDIP